MQCCGRVQSNSIALNLEMINNNHDLDFKRHDLKQNVNSVSSWSQAERQFGKFIISSRNVNSVSSGSQAER